VDSAVPPGIVLAGQAQHQQADRPDSSWPTDSGGSGGPGVPSRDEVTVPAQHGLRADQQPDFTEYVAGQLVEQGGEPGPDLPW
jgi:hypothetical protein